MARLALALLPFAAEPPATVAQLRRTSSLLEAFDGDRLEVHLQPVVSLPQRRVRLLEILARLRLNPDTLLVRPSSCRCSNGVGGRPTSTARSWPVSP